jgi:tRNA threonylcarbamoyladenosine biosynthesis protein TsaE
MTIQSRTLLSSSEAATQKISRMFSAVLQPGDCIGLFGPLGSGKTVFVRGLCEGLGYQGQVTSPTFTIMHNYPAKLPIYHFDCFRIRRPQEMISTGFDEFIELQKGIVVVEWAELIRDYFQAWDYEIQFNQPSDPAEENERHLGITAREPERLDEFFRLYDEHFKQG